MGHCQALLTEAEEARMVDEAYARVSMLIMRKPRTDARVVACVQLAAMAKVVVISRSSLSLALSPVSPCSSLSRRPPSRLARLARTVSRAQRLVSLVLSSRSPRSSHASSHPSSRSSLSTRSRARLSRRLSVVVSHASSPTRSSWHRFCSRSSRRRSTPRCTTSTRGSRCGRRTDDRSRSR